MYRIGGIWRKKSSTMSQRYDYCKIKIVNFFAHVFERTYIVQHFVRINKKMNETLSQNLSWNIVIARFISR